MKKLTGHLYYQFDEEDLVLVADVFDGKTTIELTQQNSSDESFVKLLGNNEKSFKLIIKPIK